MMTQQQVHKTTRWPLTDDNQSKEAAVTANSSSSDDTTKPSDGDKQETTSVAE